MILLDTNVLSEFMRPRPAPEVVAWLDGQVANALHVSAEDAQIAAIALARGMQLATRNTADFRHIDGLSLIDPGSAAA